MATLGSRLLTNAVRQSRKHLLQSQRQISTTPKVLYLGYWNKDWKPAPLPRTPEERAAAAKKYGLRPEDYNVLEDGSLGDYPNLPVVASSLRDPWEDYDLPHENRNFGEPIHSDSDLLGFDLTDPNTGGMREYRRKATLAILYFLGFVTVNYIMSFYPIHPPEMPKQYPFNDLHLEKGGDPENEPKIRHYTFDPPSY